MQYLVSILIVSLIPLLLSVIDRKIKGKKSIIRKILSLALVVGILAFTIYFYGGTLLEAFHINSKSFTSMKSFISMRAVVIISMLLLFLFVVIKTFFYIVIFKEKRTTLNTFEKAFTLVTVIFDMFLIPNISNSNTVAVFFIATILELGLVSCELVFSFENKKEVIA